MKPWFRSMVFHTKLKVITRKRLFLGSESRWNHDKIFETLSLARDFVRVGEIPHAKNFKPLYETTRERWLRTEHIFGIWVIPGSHIGHEKNFWGQKFQNAISPYFTWTGRP